MEKCPGCGRWFDSRRRLFGHGAHCTGFQTFSEEWHTQKEFDKNGMTWRQYKDWYIENNILL